MSSHQYIPSSGGLFDDDGDVDDAAFLRNSRPRVAPSASQSSAAAALDARTQVLLEKKQAIEERILDSSVRSLGVLRDSEKIGIASAEELLRQREQLENSSRRLDEINANLRFSQKHLNGIKSVFSSLKNYISGRNEGVTSRAPSVIPEDGRPAPSPLGDVVQQRSTNPFEDHPAARLRGLDDNPQRQVYSDEASGSKRMNERLEANLNEMVSSITRLKGLAINLGDEIESQNDLIDDIHDKVEVADITIGKQNKQMNKILGK